MVPEKISIFTKVVKEMELRRASQWEELNIWKKSV